MPILIGGLVYLLFRDDSIFFNQLIRPTLHFFDLPLKMTLPNWFVYALPDGLFVYSYVFFMLDNWKGKLSLLSLSYSLFLPLILIVIEFGQYFGVFKGTFDKLDLIFYLLGVFLAFTITKGLKSWQRKKCL